MNSSCCSTSSRTGERDKLSLAKSLVNEPEILFLDEPTVGLDPEVSIRVRKLIHTIHRERGTTIVLTTHYMREAEELCERIAFLKKGEVLAEGTPAELKAMIKVTRSVEILYRGTVDAGLIQNISGIKGAEFSGNTVRVCLAEPEERLDELLAAVRRTAKICHVKVSEVDLEDVFIAFTKP
jgi:ABC-2 type transport system ATP-binding protein